ncbi:hypothetical protein [Streptomyces sp. NPDC056632]
MDSPPSRGTSLAAAPAAGVHPDPVGHRVAAYDADESAQLV